MAELQKTLISGPFGTENVPVQDFAAPGTQQPSALPLETNRVPVSDQTFAREPGFKEARAARVAEQYRPDSNFLEAVGAGMSLWDTTRLVNRIARPVFDDDTPISQFEAFEQLDFVPTADEREYLQEVGKGTKSFQYAVGQIKDRRVAQRVLGDHPVTGFATAFLDPVWLAVPPSVSLGKLSPVAGRAVSTAASAGISGAVTALGEGPVADTDIALNMLVGAATGAAFYRNGKLERSADVPPSIDPDAVARDVQASVKVDPAQVVAEVDARLAGGSTKSQSAFAWNMHKTMSNFGPVGKRIADRLYDNNADLSINSLESHREAVLHDLRQLQYGYEDKLRAAMGEDGYGFFKMANPFTSRKAAQAQQNIERQVQRELFRREQAARTGGTVVDASVPKRITEMADALDSMHKRALAEMKAAGVEGAEAILERPGYLNRKWSSQQIDTVMNKLEGLGLNPEQARARVNSLVSLALHRANGWERELSDQVGSAIVDRALRKGYFEDAVFNVPAGERQLGEMRDVLNSSGMNAQQVERALNVMRVQTDEAGKAGVLKHRMDLDYRASMRVGDETISVMDLIDGRVASIVDQYNAQVATQVAFAQKGFKRRSDVEAMRSELLHSITDPLARKEAEQLFDNTIAHFRGEPSGQAMNDKFRLAQAYGRSISLAWSGLWQMTEFANAAAQYGLGKTLKYAMKEFPGFKALLNPSTDEARTLVDVLSEQSASSQRLRPYLARFEDGYEMDMGNALQLSAQTIGQSVPYANAMKYVHHYQARVTGNLILDRMRMAAGGNTQAREALAKYGLEAPVMDKLKAQIDAHGFNVDAWDDAVWSQARPAFAKMMDAAVLRGRLGDVPAFAAFDQVGKFLFTYRSFVLVAHNKVLAGTASREGAGAVGMIMMYQFPLAMAAVQAQSIVSGKGALSEEDMIKKSIGQMGGLGLFSEPMKWATGESNAIGAPGLIPFDRGVKLFQNTAQGNMSGAASTALTMLPVASAIPFLKAIPAEVKGD